MDLGKAIAMEEILNDIPDNMIHPDDLEPVRGLKDPVAVTWDEVEDENIILNPDPDSMQGRG